MGELFRESVKRIEKLDFGSLRTCIFLGKIGGLNQSDNIGLQIHLIPRYKAQGTGSKEVIPIPVEVLEVAKQLRQVADIELIERGKKLNQLEAQIEISLKH